MREPHRYLNCLNLADNNTHLGFLAHLGSHNMWQMTHFPGVHPESLKLHRGSMQAHGEPWQKKQGNMFLEKRDWSLIYYLSSLFYETPVMLWFIRSVQSAAASNQWLTPNKRAAKRLPWRLLSCILAHGSSEISPQSRNKSFRQECGLEWLVWVRSKEI